MKLISNRLFTSVFALMLFFTTGNLMAQDEDRMGDDDRMRDQQEQIVDEERKEVLKSDAEEAIEAFVREDPAMEQHLENAVAYAVFPNVGKGAYILGGAAGNGVVYEDDEVVGFAELRQVDLGLQIGGKAFREIIIFRTQEAYDRFKEGNFEFEGSASAVIWDEGAGESVQFQDGVGVALMPKAGAMAGISVGGQKFNYADADNTNGSD